MSNPLLINFKSKTSVTGARRESLKAIADNLGVTETAAVHIAINRLYLKLFHGGAEYDFPTTEQTKWLNAQVGTVSIAKTQTLADLIGQPAQHE